MQNLKLNLVLLCFLHGFVRCDSCGVRDCQRTVTPAQQRAIAVLKDLQELGPKVMKPQAQVFSLACERAWWVGHKELLKSLVKEYLLAFDNVVQHLDELLTTKSVEKIAQHESIKNLVDCTIRVRAERRAFLIEYARTSNDVRAQKVLEQDKVQDGVFVGLAKIVSDPANDLLLASFSANQTTIASIKSIVHHLMQKSVQLIDDGMVLAHEDVAKCLTGWDALMTEPIDQEKLSRQICCTTLIVVRDWVLPVLQEISKGFCFIPEAPEAIIAEQLSRVRTTIVPRALALVGQDTWFAQLPQNVRSDCNLLLNVVFTSAVQAG